MRKIFPLFLILIFFNVSCYNSAHKVPCKDFLKHLNENEELINDSVLYRWRAWSRYDENCSNYFLWYDTGRNMLYDKYGEFGEVVVYNVETEECIFKEFELDTTALCKYWGIAKDSFLVHIETVCKHIRKITDGYQINEMGFYRNGFCVFLSAYNNWGIVYQKDSLPNNNITQDYRLMLLRTGYSQVGNTRFWVHENTNPKRDMKRKR